MNKKFLAMAALALITTGAQAKVKLPHILGDNMILQQNTEANLWGWDKPGTTVGNHLMVWAEIFCQDRKGWQMGYQSTNPEGELHPTLHHFR